MNNPMDNMVHRDMSGHFFLFCILSVVFHLCLVALGVGLSLLQPSDPFLSNAVQVDLVSFSPDTAPTPGDIPPATMTEPETPHPTKPEPEPEEPPSPLEDTIPAEPRETSETDTAPEPQPVIQPDLSLKSKPKNLKEMLEKTEPPKKTVKKPVKKLQTKPDAREILARARKRLNQKLKEQEQEHQSQINQALARMNQKVQKGQKPGGSGGASGGSASGKVNDALDLYKMVLSSAIRQNWIFNETMTRINQGLETRLRIKILQNGEIRDIIYEKPSGNHYLDDSAKKAIQRANPFPPLPNGMKSYTIGVIFTPRGLQ